MSWDIFGTEREALRKEISNLKSQKFQTEHYNQKLKQEIDNLELQLKEISYYRNEYDLACREIDVLNYKLATLTKNYSSLQKSYTALEQEKRKNHVSEPPVPPIAEDVYSTLKQKEEEIKRITYELNQTKSELEDVNGNLEYLLSDYRSLQNTLEELVALNQKNQAIEDIEEHIETVSKLPFAKIPKDYKDSILSGRLATAFNATDISIQGQINISATIQSGDHYYNTNLFSCDCPDFRSRHIPCKHMLFLSYTSGLMLLNKEALSFFAKNNILKLNTKIEQEKEAAANAKKQNQILQRNKRNSLQISERLQQELDQSYPWLAGMYKRFQIEQDNHDAYMLSPHASTAKDIVKKLKSSNKELKYQNALLENQLLVYETLFPWLEEFKNVDVDKAVEYVRQTQDDKEYDNASNYLSPAEYKTLSTTKKNQLALDRYKKHRKSDWEIGVDYERYIGYCYETNGYRVEYSGALDQLKDMGRDLICTKGKETLIVQCKRWSSHKTIHEKHIFQLYGSTMQLQFLNPDKEYISVFVTTTKLSDVAKYCASQLNIQVIENEKFNDYPCIKCNVSRDGTKIYHLPFDQQYDRISIDTSAGECYVATVEEAEQKGFRRAFRHHAT